MRAVNIIGETYGQLLVIAEAPSRIISNESRRFVRVRCTCGAENEVSVSNLRSGNTTSCGCVHKQKISLMATSHGQTGTRLYAIWNGMKTRCYNPKAQSYPYYGGRGITICDEWMVFEPFYEWAMSNGYSDDLTIERNDGDQGYSPNNCSWATKSQQAFNRKKRNIRS